MILTAGLTPAWQQILVFDQFQTGEVNRAREAHWCASGKVLNVAIALHHLVAPNRTVCLVGGESGGAIKREFDQHGISAHWIESKSPTRVCTTILSTGNPATELVENTAAATSAELRAFEAVFRDEVKDADLVILTGSLPAATPSTFYRDLLREARSRAILDVRGPELLEALGERPYLVKPNREELERTVGRPLRSSSELIDAMHKVNAAGAEWVCVTHGAEAVYLTSATHGYQLQPPRVDVVNTIGCGDCLTAGIAAALSGGADTVEAVRHGIAAAGENATMLLPARLNLERVQDLERAVHQSHVR